MSIKQEIRDLENDIYSANMGDELHKADVLMMFTEIANILMQLNNELQDKE